MGRAPAPSLALLGVAYADDNDGESPTGLPGGLRDGDVLIYYMHVRGNISNDTVRASGSATVRVLVEDGWFKLVLENQTLPEDASRALMYAVTFSDLVALVVGGEGAEVEYTSDWHPRGPQSYECPVIRAGVHVGEEAGGGLSGYVLPGMYADVDCEYVDGVLTSLRIELRGSYGEESVQPTSGRAPPEPPAHDSLGWLEGFTAQAMVAVVLLGAVLALAVVLARRGQVLALLLGALVNPYSTGRGRRMGGWTGYEAEGGDREGSARGAEEAGAGGGQRGTPRTEEGGEGS